MIFFECKKYMNKQINIIKVKKAHKNIFKKEFE